MNAALQALRGPSRPVDAVRQSASMRPTVAPDRAEFIEAWNALDRQNRLRIRRLVRLGRPVDPAEARLAAAYAAFQSARPWARLFWFWFVPGLLIAVAVASTIHPLVIGVVLALGAQAAFAHRNLEKA